MAGTQSITDLTDELLWALLDAAPDIAANLGIDEVAGRRLAPDRLPDFSPEGALHRRELLTQWSTRCSECIDASDGDLDAVTAGVLSHVVDNGVYSVFPGRHARDFVNTPWPVTHLNGPHVTLTNLLARDHWIGDADDADAYLSRLKGFPEALDGTLELLRVRADQGIRAPRFTLEKSLADIEQFMTADPADNLLVRALSTRTRAAGLASAVVHDRVAQAERLLHRLVYPAYERLASELRRVLGKEDSGETSAAPDGALQLPNGADYYCSRLRTHTTTDLSPAAIHEIGRQQLVLVQERVRSQAARIGIKAESMPELFADLERTSPAPVMSEHGKILARMRQLIAGSSHAYRELFTRWPNGSVDVSPIPPALADSIHSHYVPADARNLRTATFHVNLQHLAGLRDADLAVLCHHEVFPGHHVQLSLAQQDAALPAFRRAMLFAGALEGWAKYAETFPMRYDAQPNTMTALSGLKGELYSTANLVLDTGLHWCGWSRQQACEFFINETAAPPALARMLSDRSAVTPGQLCAYKLGMLCVTGLADRFATDTGATRRLHDTVLSFGAVPLPILEREVKRQLKAEPTTMP